jgi:hypothetical protein
MRPLFIAVLGILGTLSVSANQDPPKNLRVCVQFIEMPHPVLTELLSGKAESGDGVHEKAMALVKEGKAKLLESCMIRTLSEQKAKIETICEIISPTDPGIPSGISSTTSPPDPPPPTHQFPITAPGRPTPLAYETRNAGVSLEIEPTLNPDVNTINLRFLIELVNLSDLTMIQKYTDEWGDASIRRPYFETWRNNTTLTLVPGKFELAATITHKPADLVPATLRKILVFARCDVIEVPR